MFNLLYYNYKINIQNNIIPDCSRQWLALLWRPAASGATAGASAITLIILLLFLLIIIIIISNCSFILPWLEEFLRPNYFFF